MAIRVKYIGPADRFSEVGITGQQQQWHIGESGYVSDANAALLVASGLFSYLGSGVVPFDPSNVDIGGGNIGGTTKVRGRSVATFKALKAVAPVRSTLRKVMATPPTPTLTTTATLVSPTQFSFTSVTGGGTLNQNAGNKVTVGRAGAPAIKGTTFPDYQYTKFTNVNYGPGGQLYNQALLAVEHYGSAMEITFKGTGGVYLIKINDEYVSLSANTVPNDGALYYLYIPFGSTALRRVEFLIYNLSPGSINVAATDDLRPAPMRGPRTIIVGDSFTEGTGSNQVDSWPNIFADAMGWDDVWSSGVGSTGYIADGSATRLKFRDRVTTDVIPFAPDVVMFAGGINDYSIATAAQIGIECNLLFAQVRSSLPNALIVVLSPFWRNTATSMSQSLLDAKAAIKSAATANGALFLDFLEMPLPQNVTPQVTTLAASAAQNATTLSFTNAPALFATYQFATGGRFYTKSATGSGPFTVTIDGAIGAAHSSGEVVTQVGDCFWTGNGKVGALAGFGNSDIFVGSDGTHPTVAGHFAIGSTAASMLLQALA